MSSAGISRVPAPCFARPRAPSPSASVVASTASEALPSASVAPPAVAVTRSLPRVVSRAPQPASFATSHSPPIATAEKFVSASEASATGLEKARSPLSRLIESEPESRRNSFVETIEQPRSKAKRWSPPFIHTRPAPNVEPARKRMAVEPVSVSPPKVLTPPKSSSPPLSRISEPGPRTPFAKTAPPSEAFALWKTVSSSSVTCPPSPVLPFWR